MKWTSQPHQWVEQGIPVEKSLSQGIEKDGVFTREVVFEKTSRRNKAKLRRNKTKLKFPFLCSQK